MENKPSYPNFSRILEILPAAPMERERENRGAGEDGHKMTERRRRTEHAKDQDRSVYSHNTTPYDPTNGRL
jgi:hypothetical protein